MKQVSIEGTNAIVELYIYDCAGQPVFNQADMSNRYVCNVGYHNVINNNIFIV